MESGNTLLILNAGAMTVEVVLADARAPGKLDGFALAHWLEENRPGTHVVLAGTIASQAKKAADLCEDGPHLSKPYDPQLLVDRIKRALAARDRAKKR
jgi:DNA-binding NtrC family response regulator